MEKILTIFVLIITMFVIVQVAHAQNMQPAITNNNNTTQENYNNVRRNTVTYNNDIRMSLTDRPKYLSGFKYDNIKKLEDGNSAFFAVQKDNKWALYEREYVFMADYELDNTNVLLKQKTDFEYDAIELVRYHLFFVKNDKGKGALYYLDKGLLTDFLYDDAQIPCEYFWSYAALKKDNKWALFNYRIVDESHFITEYYDADVIYSSGIYYPIEYVKADKVFKFYRDTLKSNTSLTENQKIFVLKRIHDDEQIDIVTKIFNSANTNTFKKIMEAFDKYDRKCGQGTLRNTHTQGFGIFPVIEKIEFYGYKQWYDIN